MSAWRIDDTDPTRPVHLNLGGPYPLRLTVTEAMSLLRTAPKMAGEWVISEDGAQRRNAAGVVVAEVWHQSTEASGRECWIARTAVGDVAGVSLAAAMVRGNEALRAAGWLLEDG